MVIPGRWTGGIGALLLQALVPDANAQTAERATVDANAGATPLGSPEPRGDSTWTVDATVYGWFAGTAGKITPLAGAPTIAFDASFGEVLQDLDAAFLATAHARKDDLVLFADVSFASLSRDGRVPPGVPARGEVSQLSLTAAAGARLFEGSGLAVDLLAGARLWNVETRVEIPLAGVSISPDQSFIDPIIATRIVAQVAPRLSALGYVDLGGAGVGSDFTYQIVGALNYRIGRQVFVSAGYRHLALDYREGGTAFDGTMTGPVIGFTKRF